MMTQVYSNESPLVSIIMPVYNGERFILESVRSVLQQTYSRWELLIVNDGSTDKTKEIVQSISDKRVHYFEQFNKGVSAARNLGLRNMKGEFFCFLDSDDILTSHSIESRLDVFGESESIHFVDGHVDIYDHSLTSRLRERKATVKGHPFRELLKMNPGIFFGPTWMVRKLNGVTYALKEDMKYCEDLSFYFSISFQGNYSYTDQTILKYRTHNQSAMRNLDGLAVGYTQLVNYVIKEFSGKLTVLDRWILKLRVRKIMALSFGASGMWVKGIMYGIKGTSV